MRSEIAHFLFAAGPLCGLVAAITASLGNRLFGRSLAIFTGTIVAMAGPVVATYYILAALAPQHAPLLYFIAYLPLTIPLSLVTFLILHFLLART